MAAQFRLLGAVEVNVDGRPVPIGYAQLRCVLAVLLVEVNRPVSVDHVVERVWATRRLPHQPRRAVQHAMTLLRGALAPATEVIISRNTAGYQLTTAPDTIDLHRFDTLVTQARAATGDERAAALFEQALRLWQGEPFTGLDTPWLNALRASLVARRQSARLDLTDIHLRHGRHTALVADLAEQAVHHPLDERLAGQYLLALYRSGRQAEALEHYHRLERLLAEELGVDPSPPLRLLHQQILTANPTLATSAPPAATSRPVPVPQQLPAPPRVFTGRAGELDRLDAAMAEKAISSVSGLGGIGKTWLALHWAHRHLDQFPDGQLHVNLRGFDPTGQPVAPAEAVRGFLDALGVSPAAIPADLEAQVGLYRSLVADKHMLIMLDNAHDTDQVTPLLPGGPTCTVLVTSRHHLGGLVTAHGARCIDLEVLPAAEATQVLTSHLGRDRIAAEPEAVTELLDCCAGLPLALGIVAARATRHPHFPLATLAAELRDQSRRLDALDLGHPQATLRAALSWSVQALSDAATTAFELLGLAPGTDIGWPAAASLLGRVPATATALLRELEDASLIQQHAPSRYRLHDLVRLYAANQADRHLPEDVRLAALRRVVDHYTHTAFAGDRFLSPHRDPIDIADCQPYPLTGLAEVLRWFDAEHLCVLAALQLAAAHGWHTAVWRLAWTLDTFHHRRGHLHDNVACWQAALAAAERLDERTLVQAHAHLGIAYSRTDQHAAAVHHLELAVTLAERSDDTRTRARLHYGLALAKEQQGDVRQALTHAKHSLHLYQTLDNPVGKARALNSVGWYHAHLGHHEQARKACERALSLACQHNDRATQAAILDSLGYLAHRTGQHTRALDYHREVLALLRDLGDAYHEADTLAQIGDVHHARGHHTEARDAWRQASILYGNQHRPGDVDRIQQRLAAS
jgi:DNA-binding SARP family transcriptional activator/tetratricopeptide (TPR) repeat protein